MTSFSYKASNPEGGIEKGTLDAPDERGAVSLLHDMGYIPIRVSEAGREKGRFDFDVTSQALALFRRISPKDVMHFTLDLASLLEAGLPVDRALNVLIDVAENDKFKDVVRDALKTVQGGGYLSDGLAKHPKVFTTLYVNMVRAGEVGGVLESVLQRLSLFLESSQELRDFVKSALIYPLFLLFVGGASIIILLTFVIPKFSVIFSDMGQSIPLSTRFLLGFSEMVRTYWPGILLVCGLGVYLFQRYIKTPGGRMRLDEYRLRLPVLGDLVRKIEVARFARTLGTLTRSGVPILQALLLVKDIITNQVLAGSMAAVYERVKEGDRLSKPLLEMAIFPSLAVQMITVGEETGRLDEMLLRVAENYEKAVRDTVKRLISLMEPAMILGMGLVVGFIVISMLLAVFSMNEMPF